MEVLICQFCNRIIDFIEGEKSGVLYGICMDGCELEGKRVVGYINNKWSRNDR